MTVKLHQLSFSGEILERGFWLYVWEVAAPDGARLYYVGRTGDSSSTNAQSPFNRMGQHLGFAANSNMLRRHLVAFGVKPERCSFRLVAAGYEVMNEVSSRMALDPERFAEVRAAFARAFPDLATR